MRKICLTVTLLLTIVFTAHSQNYLNKRKQYIMIAMAHDIKKYNVVVTQTDSTVSFKMIGPLKPSEMIVHFDQYGRCDNEVIIDECEECYHERINKLLKGTWTKVNNDKYISKKYELITHYQNQPFAFQFSKVVLN